MAITAELTTEAATIADVGCGTGNLAVRLAALGYTVLGVDRAADLALMTGNVAQVFLTDDWTRTVLAIAAALRPGGRFVFETRRPERRAWEEWAAETAPVVREELETTLHQCGFDVVDVREAPDRMGKEYVFITRRRNHQ